MKVNGWATSEYTMTILVVLKQLMIKRVSEQKQTIYNNGVQCKLNTKLRTRK